MAEPLVVSLANEFRQELLAREASAVAAMARRWLAIEAAIETEVLQLAEDLAAERDAGKSFSTWKLYRMLRYQRLLLQLQELLSAFNVRSEGEIGTTAAQNALQGLQDAITMIDAAIIDAGGQAVQVAFDRLGSEAAENIAALARAGQPLNRLLERSYPLAVEAITNQLISGTALGLNPREVARRVVQQGLADGLNHILLVARDQGIRSYRLAGWQQYQTSGVVESYTRLAAKQPGRTCLACLALDGTVWPTNRLMPLHPQDRCSMVPNIIGFARIGFDSGETYFRTLPRDEQLAWMGPERFALWDAGQFEFRQMAKVVENRTWGSSAQVRPLRELRKE